MRWAACLSILTTAFCVSTAMGQEYYHGMAYYGSGYRDSDSAPSYYQVPTYNGSIYSAPTYGGEEFYHGRAYYGDGYTRFSLPPAIYYPSANIASDSVPSQPVNKAFLEVKLPDPQSKVWVNGYPTTTTGTDRLYVTTPPAGSATPYIVKASWKLNGKDVVVEWPVPVIVGRTNLIDFQTAQPTMSTTTTP